MKYYMLVLVMLGGPALGLLTRVRDRNAAVADATAAYRNGNAPRAAQAFAAALTAQHQKSPDPRLMLNLAHAQVRAGQTAAAHTTYGRLLTGTPAAFSSVARQQLAVLLVERGELAQALGLLRQALLLDSNNAGARYDYEVLSDYIAHRPNTPQINAPPKAPTPNKAKPSSTQDSTAKNKPAEKAGTDRKGQVNDNKPASAPTAAREQQPSANGQPDNQRANASPGNAASGSYKPGTGMPQPVPTGTTSGNQRGLDGANATPASGAKGRSNRAGSDAATPADVQLQTQRERLQAMNLSPAQARQLLETLRAQEQQYLQQVTRPATQKPDPSKPTW
jgi:tetratricopeptide (TPR) repeat protein